VHSRRRVLGQCRRCRSATARRRRRRERTACAHWRRRRAGAAAADGRRRCATVAAAGLPLRSASHLRRCCRAESPTAAHCACTLPQRRIVPVLSHSGVLCLYQTALRRRATDGGRACGVRASAWARQIMGTIEAATAVWTSMAAYWAMALVMSATPLAMTSTPALAWCLAQKARGVRECAAYANAWVRLGSNAPARAILPPGRVGPHRLWRRSCRFAHHCLRVPQAKWVGRAVGSAVGSAVRRERALRVPVDDVRAPVAELTCSAKPRACEPLAVLAVVGCCTGRIGVLPTHRARGAERR
jgi:hypothetical protein